MPVTRKVMPPLFIDFCGVICVYLDFRHSKRMGPELHVFFTWVQKKACCGFLYSKKAFERVAFGLRLLRCRQLHAADQPDLGWDASAQTYTKV